jgi:DNA-binding NarL/FixJ family response regulator
MLPEATSVTLALRCPPTDTAIKGRDSIHRLSSGVVRVVLGRDGILMQEAVEWALSDSDRVELVRVCESLEELRGAVSDDQPDVVVTTIGMRPRHADEGIRLAVELGETHPGLGVVIITNTSEMKHATALFGDGATRRAYVIEERVKTRSELPRIVLRLAAGGSYIDTTVLGPMLIDARASPSPLDRLTPQQRTVLRLVAEGSSNLGIATATGITTRRVERLMNAIYTTLGLHAQVDSNRRVRAALNYLHAPR